MIPMDRPGHPVEVYNILGKPSPRLALDSDTLDDFLSNAWPILIGTIRNRTHKPLLALGPFAIGMLNMKEYAQYLKIDVLRSKTNKESLGFSENLKFVTLLSSNQLKDMADSGSNRHDYLREVNRCRRNAWFDSANRVFLTFEEDIIKALPTIVKELVASPGPKDAIDIGPSP
jgi:hypothetical protein